MEIIALVNINIEKLNKFQEMKEGSLPNDSILPQNSNKSEILGLQGITKGLVEEHKNIQDGNLSTLIQVTRDFHLAHSCLYNEFVHFRGQLYWKGLSLFLQKNSLGYVFFYLVI